MFKGFNITLQNNAFSKDESRLFLIGKQLYDNQKATVNKKISDFALDTSGVLDGSAMQNNWFPQIEADIFISHSHADQRLAICLAGWLYDTFKITSFIDSCVWGYADELLKSIDDIFCRTNSPLSYDYGKTKHSASHVHMMLSTALTMMIDKSECLFFLNTPNSIVTSEVINKTKSPWIYSEITISKLIAKRSPDRLSKIIMRSKISSLNEALTVYYNLDLSHLDNMNVNTLINWKKHYFNNNSIYHNKYSNDLLPIDYLYDLYRYLEEYKY